MPKRSAATIRRLEASMGTLASAAIARMDEVLPWYRAMPAENRSWVNLVAQAGVAAFVEWFRQPEAPQAISADVFGTAPRELTRSVTLQQTVELVRVVIAVVEEQIEQIAPGDEAEVREAVLRYSREIAFAAAQVYAEAAEARGAWDARLESLVVDALLRGEADDSLRSRAAALGWGSHDSVVVVVGNTPDAEPEAVVDEIRRVARAAHLDVLTGVQGDRLVAILGGHVDPVRTTRLLVAQAGVAAFVEWFRQPDAPQAISADVFGTAPRELTRSVTLQQTVELVRVVIAVVEEQIEQIAPGDEAEVREAVLRYSREIAFAAAQVYAEAAEARGAWDARLESLVVDALLRGEADDSLRSRAAALGWGSHDSVVVVVGNTPDAEPEAVVDVIRRVARAAHLDVLTGVQGDRLVAILGGDVDPVRTTKLLVAQFGPGPVVVGPAVADLLAAGESAAAAVAGLMAAPAWPDAPRPVQADDLLPERALAGDDLARERLVQEIYRPLQSTGTALVETLSAFLEQTSSLEATARVLFVHPNTVRYRLRRVTEVCGYAPADPRQALTLRMALALGRLADARLAAPGVL